MSKYTTLFMLLWMPLAAFPQAPTYSEGNEENYAFEVKVIDEFIERFNGESLLLEEYIKKKKLPYKTDRFTMLRDLFDKHTSQKWNVEEVKQFISQVMDSAGPVYLNFNDTNWYAELNCKMIYKGKPQKVDILLNVQTEGMNCKWMITSIHAGFLPSAETLPVDSLKTIKAFLNPVSHATDFMGLHRALKDKGNLQSYFSVERDPSMIPFIQALEKGELEYVQVNKVTYHFLQVKGWAFTVQQFVRQDKNSGWLISKLTKADEGTKEHYPQKLFK